jgi:cyclic pyranopterin phosphate synthase
MPFDSSNIKKKFLNKEILSFEEIIKIVNIISTLGIKKIRFTGGEPLLRRNLCDLIWSIHKYNPNLKLMLTTNGILLPKYVLNLRKAGIKYITVSLGSLNNNVFQKLNGCKGSVKEVLFGIKCAEQAGFNSLKINVAILKQQNYDSIIDVANYFKGTKHIVRYIEFMDVGNCNNWKLNNVIYSEEIINIINKKMPLYKLKPHYSSEVAQRFAYCDGEGEIGFISSVSNPFCESCSRLRLSADGKLYTCLFSTIGYDIKFLLRQSMDKEYITNYIKNIWKNRIDQYSRLRLNKKHNKNHKKIEMYQIGG